MSNYTFILTQFYLFFSCSIRCFIKSVAFFWDNKQEDHYSRHTHVKLYGSTKTVPNKLYVFFCCFFKFYSASIVKVSLNKPGHFSVRRSQDLDPSVLFLSSSMCVLKITKCYNEGGWGLTKAGVMIFKKSKGHGANWCCFSYY